MKITKPTIRLSEEELSILERAKDICDGICENCPTLGHPYDQIPEYAENAAYNIACLLDIYNDHVNEEG